MRGKCMRIVQCGPSQAVAGSAEAASPRSPGGRCRLSSRVHLLRPGRAGACETFHTRRRVSSGKDAVCLSRRRPRGRSMSGPCLIPADVLHLETCRRLHPNQHVAQGAERASGLWREAASDVMTFSAAPCPASPGGGAAGCPFPRRRR